MNSFSLVRLPHFVLGAVLGLELRDWASKQEQFAVNNGQGEQQALLAAASSAADARGSSTMVVLTEVCSVLMGLSLAVCAVLGHLYGPRAWWLYLFLGEFAALPLHG